jgi:hypothetical protein|tara:strand:+ start:302 stop:514 length:213 start_codon:yes stop_codon:yes gene_type:complete
MTSNVHRNFYVSAIGEAVNQGGQGLPFLMNTILVNESFNNLEALDARRDPNMTIMVKLAAGQSLGTGYWE